MSSKFCAFVLKALGWTSVGNKVEEDKCIFLAAPHTSIWDFVIGYLYYRALGGHLRTMIKKEAFVWPLAPILRAMGGFPIDRKNPQSLMVNIIHEMEQPGDFHLVICPEGTRKPVRKWKTGYHTIAQEAGIPVYITFFDYKTKRVGIAQKFEITENARADTDRIQQIYEDMHLTGLHPEDFVTR